MESAIFALFKIDLTNYIKVKSILAKEFHLPPSEIDAMAAWEYELFMKEINNAVKEENERNQKEMDKYDIEDMKKMSSSKYMSKMHNNAMSKISSIPKMPKLPNTLL